eukprot:CAMPEP_0116917078 /NCGR_PEP_ID=MMETSP0467-20121206/18925_1 /TAXON_ID=283647 /ORGANISM="Mesodinium pulex, Strain SPMC105" /LENGTH=92 /DNA_ID=CAMNT_0004594095 /DNA_START=546 /DNA_END=824 /DNA_ORIENTATION=+
MKTLKTLALMGVPVESAHHEYSGTQYEIATGALEGIHNPDAGFKLKNVVPEVSRQFGLDAQFVSKFKVEEDGNGCHFNISLWAIDENDKDKK